MTVAELDAFLALVQQFKALTAHDRRPEVQRLHFEVITATCRLILRHGGKADPYPHLQGRDYVQALRHFGWKGDPTRN